MGTLRMTPRKQLGVAWVIAALVLSSSVSAVEISWVSPDRGSIAGGTKVTIFGSGFSRDIYAGGNVIMFGDVPCTNIWFYSTTTSIVCVTEPMNPPHVSTGPVPVTVLVDSTEESVCRGNCWFSFIESESPSVSRIDAAGATAGSLISVEGRIFSEDLSLVERIYVGDNFCDMRDPITGDYYPYSWLNWPYMSLQCRPAETNVGLYGVKTSIPSRGDSVTEPSALKVSSTLELYTFQIVPEITSFAPSHGSVEGGSVISVEGAGFGSDPAGVDVSVGGVPCTVDPDSMSDTALTCTIADRFSASAVKAFPGNRGAKMDLYFNIDGNDIASLRRAPSFPNSPDVSKILTGEVSGPFNEYDRYGTRIVGAFIPPVSDNYTFFVASDDNSELRIGSKLDGSDAKTVVVFNVWVNRFQWHNYAQQRSAVPIWLDAGVPYYLDVLCKEGYGLDTCAVAALAERSPYSAKETGNALQEVQVVSTVTTVSAEVHTISVVGAGNSNNTFVIEWDGVQTRPLQASSTAAEVTDALNDILATGCDITDGDDVYDLDDFEGGAGSSDDWTSRDGWDPAIVTTTAFCGRSSLYFPTGLGRNFEGGNGLEGAQKSSGYSTRWYPNLCMAYRVPPTTRANMLIFDVVNGWLSLPLTDIFSSTSFAYPRIGSWDTIDSPLETDGEWHYKCIDVNEMLDEAYPDDPDHVIAGIIMYPPGNDFGAIGGEFWIDEFSVSALPREVGQTTRPARPNGIDIERLSVARRTKPGVVSFDVTITPVGCPVGFPLMSALSAALNASVVRSVPASAPLGGNFTLSFRNRTTVPIPFDASADRVASAIFPLIGRATVTPSWRGCAGYDWTITFDSINGRQPLLAANASNLSGTEARVPVTEKQLGGLFFAPIQAEMMRTIHSTPQVTVARRLANNGSLTAVCNAANGCEFAFLEADVALVTAVSPAAGAVGTTITLTGSGFVSGMTVAVGGTACTNVIVASEASATCVLGHSTAGTNSIDIIVPVKGRGRSIATLIYNLTATSTSHSVSSIAGGLELDIVGDGFSPIASDNSVTVEGVGACIVTASTHTKLTCLTPVSSAGEVLNRDVVVAVRTLRAVASQLSFLASATREVSRVVPAVGSVGGGTMLTVFGTFHVGDVVRVTIGDVPCEVKHFGVVYVACVTGAGTRIGNQTVRAHIEGLGRSTTLANYEYALAVTNVSAISGSSLGGQRVVVSGSGFWGAFAEHQAKVFLAGAPCDVESATYSEIVCVSTRASHSYLVTNTGLNPEYGRGYAWEPDYLEVEEGDVVEWSWTSSAFTGTEHSVEQVADAFAFEYDGHGFRSERSGDGFYGVRFTRAGAYHYVSATYGDIGMRGLVVVRPAVPVDGRVTVSLGGVSASFNKTGYRRAMDTTPVVRSVEPSSGLPGTVVKIYGDRFGATATAVVAIGGVPCVSLAAISGGFACTVGEVGPGVHRVSAAFPDRGDAIVQIPGGEFSVRPLVTSISPMSGSRMGGHTITLAGHGFGASRAFVGRAECDIQSASATAIVCTTSAAGKDGYNATLYIDGAVVSVSFEDTGDEGTRAEGIVGQAAAFQDRVESAPIAAEDSEVLFGNLSSGYTFELWVRPSQNSSADVFTLVASVLGHDGGQGFAVFLAPGGRLEFWAGIGGDSRPRRDDEYASVRRMADGLDWNNADDLAALFGDDVQMFEDASGVDENQLVRRDGVDDMAFSSFATATPTGTATATATATAMLTSLLVSPTPTLLPFVLPGQWSVVEGPALPLDEWTHVVCKVTAGKQSLYVNGALVASTNVNPVHFGANSIDFGGSILDEVANFTGFIDEAAIYRGSLRDSVIRTHVRYALSEAQPAYLVGIVSAPGINDVGYVAPSYEVLSARVGNDVHTVAGSVVEVHLPSECSSDRCYYEPKEDLTPVVTSINPAHGNGPLDIVISGSGFSSVAHNNVVEFGGAVCSVSKATHTSITCSLPPTKTSARVPKVHVTERGFADASGAQPFHFELVVRFMSPEEGSIAGGTVLTLVGVGFSPVASENTVSVGSIPCVVVGSPTETFLQCETRAVPTSAALSNLVVVVAVGDAAVTVPTRFSYTLNSTPKINFVDPTSGRSGSLLSVFGTKFSATASENTVTIGGVLCTVQSATTDSIQCILGPNVAGPRSVVARVGNLGYSLGSASFTHGLFVDTVAPVESGFGGGRLLSIGGDGFDGRPGNASANVINVCNAVCTVVSADFASITCLLSQYPGASPPTTDAQCAVVARVNGRDASWSQKYLFKTAWTSLITQFYPRRGGTAGGTLLTIVGYNFNAGSSVSIAGTPCEIASINSTVITCVTGAHTTSRTAPIRVNVEPWGDAFAVNANFDYIDVWSSCATWGRQCNKPVDGDIVYVKKGQTLLLDIATPVLEALVVEGALLFDRADGVALDAKYVLINNGRLEIGTEAEPFLQRATITMHGNIQDTELPVYGNKVLACRNCTIDIHGRPISVTWTVLAQTAFAGDSSITVRDPVNDWKPGDRIVIASTSSNPAEAEVVTIKSIGNGNKTIAIEETLSNVHVGDSVEIGGRTVNVRAEVGLLTRNIVFQGDIDPATPLGDTFGAQLFVHFHAAARLENFEVRHAGQAFRLGRYPLHFHLPGTAANSYIRGCSIHHTFNRAVTMHGVHQLRVENNVAYNIKGHTYFLEDGIESENIIRNNLGVYTQGSASLLNTDQMPATFWITNPRNHYTGNAAAGSTHAGYWFNLQDNPTGPSLTYSVCPNKSPLGTFMGNTAHSNVEFGLRVWESWVPRVNECGGGSHANADLRFFTAFSNGKGLEFSRVGHVRLLDSIITDNVNVGVEVTNAEGNWGGPMVANTLILGRSGILPGFPGTETGMRTPMSSKLTVENVTFANFDRATQVMLRGCSFCVPFKLFDGGMETRFRGIVKINVVRVASFQWEHEVLYRDLDGSLTGAKGWALPLNGLLDPAVCTSNIEFSAGFPGATCSGSVEFRRLAWNNVQPSSLDGRNAIIGNQFGNTSVPWRQKRITHPNGYMVTVPTLGTISISYDVAIKDRVDVTSYSMAAYLFGNNDYVFVGSSYFQKFDHYVISDVSDDLGRPVFANDTLGAYNFDNTTMMHKYIVSGRGKNSETIAFNFMADPCPKSGCPQPHGNDTNTPAGTRSWCDPSGWEAGVVPGDGDDAFIGSNQIVLLDCDTAHVNLLTIAGQLVFVDGADRELTATYIHVRGGRLTIGNATKPFKSHATISLTGNRKTPEMSINSRINLASKVLGVFGNVDMYGTVPNVTWTRLAATASVGATSITLDAAVTWKVGDQIVIGPTSYDGTDGETRIIASVTGGGRVVGLTVPLGRRHSGVTATYGGQSIVIAAEVGLLTRNIVIRGVDEPTGSLDTEEFGGRVLVGAYQFTAEMGAAVPTVLSGRARLSGVEFRNCGQRGWPSSTDPRHALAFKDISSLGGSFVRRCSFNYNYNSAIGVHTTEGLEISGNVAYRTVGSSYYTTSKSTILLNNLAVQTEIALVDAKDPGFDDESASFDVRVTLCTVRGNAASGSDRHGFRIKGETCGAVTADGLPSYYNNTAHSALFGFKLEGVSTCTQLAGFRAFRCWDFGVYASIESSISIMDFAIADSSVGIFLNVFGPSSVRHFALDKYVNATNGLMVGMSAESLCTDTAPVRKSMLSAAQDGVRTGIKMTSFTLDKIPGPPHGWDDIMSYPALYGSFYGDRITFARFQLDTCGRRNLAMATNPMSADATHPHYLKGVQWFDVEDESKLMYYEPDLKWINPTDCIDMDCDGLKHVVLTDVDGSFFGSVGGTIIPIAELRFDESRIPPAALKTAAGKAITPAEVAPNHGIYRDGLSCTLVDSWKAYKCAGGSHKLLIIESLDSDSETRRLSPLSLTTEGTMDLLNGPMDHGWCEHYTCLKRLSTFFAVVASQKSYTLFMTSTNPGRTRFHMPSASSSDGIVIATWYSNPQRLDVYRDGNYIEPENNVLVPGKNGEAGSVESRQGSQYIPPVTRSGGANYFERRSKLIYVVVRGRVVLDIVISPVVQVSMTLAVSVDNFYGPDLIKNLAFLLKTDPSRIKLVDVVAENAAAFRERTRRGDDAATISLQIGNPPSNTISMPTAPPPAGDDDTGAGSSNNSTDDPQAASDYQNQQNAVSDLNKIGETFVNLVQSNQLAAGLGVEVLGADISLAVAANPPPGGASGNSSDPSSGSSGGSIQVPAKMLLSSSATSVVANATFTGMLQVEVRDGSNALVNQLGILTPWNASVTIDTQANETASGATLSLSGSTVVFFANGRANFTNVVLVVAGSTQQQSIRLRITTGNGQFSVVTAEIPVSYVAQSNGGAAATSVTTVAAATTAQRTSTPAAGTQIAASATATATGGAIVPTAPASSGASASSASASSIGADAVVTPSPVAASDSSSSVSKAPIIGGVVGGTVLLLAACVGGYVWYNRSHQTWSPKRVDLRPEGFESSSVPGAVLPPTPPAPMASLAVNSVMSSSGGGVSFVPPTPLPPVGLGGAEAPISLPLPSNDPMNIKQPFDENAQRYARFVAKRNYVPKFPDEVALAVGDIVQVTDSTNASWYMGLNMTTHKWGRLPKHCVEPLASPAASPLPRPHNTPPSNSEDPFVVPELEAAPPSLLGDVVPHSVDEPRPRTPTRSPMITRAPEPEDMSIQDELKLSQGSNSSGRSRALSQ